MGSYGNQRLLAVVNPLVEPESLQSRGSRRNTEVDLNVVAWLVLYWEMM